MMKIILLPALLFLSGVLFAQNIQDAERYIYYQRYNSAEDVAEKVVLINPNDAQAWYLLTLANLKQDEVDEIKNKLASAPQTLKNTPYYKAAYGHVLLSQNKKDSAQLYFNSALDQTKHKDAGILAAVARAHINEKAGNLNYAIELIDQAIKRNKKDPGLHVLKGNAYRKLGNGSEAYSAYQSALGINKNHAEALRQLGLIFVTQKNSDMYLDYFNRAIAADNNYSPVYYDMYMHHYYNDVNQARDYFNKYVALSDPDKRNDYYSTDLLYLSKEYATAIANAKKLIAADKEEAEPRLYKLIAYSYQGLQDTATAFNYMAEYFAKAPDSAYVVKDFETMADMYIGLGKQDSAIYFLERAVDVEKDTAAQYAFYKKLSELNSASNNYSDQAKWMGMYFNNNDKATNVDLFNWGLAHFRAEEYKKSDSVFAIYSAKYPEQGFGYYWRARSTSLLDPKMEEGLAVPHYTELIAIAEKDTTSDTHKKWLVEAYAYLAAYETNAKKNYETAVDYFEKLLQIDPENEDAKKYITILEKNIEASEASDGR